MSWKKILKKIDPASIFVRDIVYEEEERKLESGSMIKEAQKLKQKNPQWTLEEIKKEIRNELRIKLEQGTDKERIKTYYYISDAILDLTDIGLPINYSFDDIDWDEVYVPILSINDKYIDALEFNNGVFEHNL